MKDLVLGSHLWFARLGSTIDGTVVTESAVPIFATTKAEWLKLPSCEQWEPRPPSNFVSRRAPGTGTGTYGVRTRIPLGGDDFTHAFNVQEFGKLDFELLLNAASVDQATGAYVTNTKVEPVVGWLHRQALHGETIIDEADELVQLTSEAFQFGENLNPHALIATVLNNTLNAGKIT
ncbi:hypothetical protein JIN85_20910, partial [Luteolibacter pohnpeiensis]